MSKPIIDETGAKRWLNDAGQLHRLDGPALIRENGFRAWYTNGKLHRAHGPAIERPSGRDEWWIDGQFIRQAARRALTGGSDGTL